MITLRDLSLRRGTQVLLQQVNWTIYPGQRIGMIGANGAGKSSLFALLLGHLQADEGELSIAGRPVFAHVAQETPAYAASALDYVMDGDTGLRHLQKELSQAEGEQDGVRIAAIHEQLSIIDAYTAPSRAGQLLAGLGFSSDEQNRPVSSFSGGWRVRLNLAQALMCRSDVLLLDEPTNHLDLDAVLWLEQWLVKYPGTLLLISHDRDFLDKTTEYIAHLAQKKLKLYTGNYSTFEKQRAADLLLQQATHEKQQKKIAHLQSFVDRFRAKATKAKQAQSRLKAIEKMDIICAVQKESPFQFAFRSPKECPHPLIKLERVTVGYHEKTVLTNVNLSLAPGERIALLGPNGAGKSSLIKCLAGELTLLSGNREASSGLKLGYFAQHQVDKLQLDESALFHLQQLAEKAQELELRTFLGSFGFSDDKIFEPVKNFSGGEKSRLALALLVWQRPNLLLLDEPTNHLDLDMRNALSIALQNYEGAVILVSHDRFLVRTTVDELMLVADGKLEAFSGDLQEYQGWLLDFRKQKNSGKVDVDKNEASKKILRQQSAKEREALKPLNSKIKQLETKLEKLQKQAKEFEINLADNAIYQVENKNMLQQTLQKQADIKQDIENTENDWLLACEERDQFQF